VTSGHLLIVAYHGASFFGWQRQPEKPTVQGVLEEALAKLWKMPIHAEASGRTDTGVHALGQAASFLAPRLHRPTVLVRALNANLPDPVRITRARWVAASFHARFDAASKTYEYRIYNSPVHDPFGLDYEWHVPRPLDVTAMRRAARIFVGTHDFAAFTSNPGYHRRTTVRTLFQLSIQSKGPKIRLRVTADGFLYRMVRNLAGALVKAGHGRLSPGEITEILRRKVRSDAPPSAPAHGLFLLKVHYPKGSFDGSARGPRRSQRHFPTDE
jgi:tRNA pseudouridine38-40 synthase